MKQQLLPEWVALDAVILAWPHEDTDWAPWLEAVHQTYINLINAINEANAAVILLYRETDISQITSLLPVNARVLLVKADFNDTWARDYAFLTVEKDSIRHPIEFVFNGWGNKFDASLDNQINANALAALCQQPLISYDTVCEGGALEIDANGCLLSTSLCLSNPERNGRMSAQQYHALFSETLGAKDILIFENGHLEGDDTDGHIDTLVRFTQEQGLVIQSAYNQPQDSHYEGLSALVDECHETLPHHKIFELPLPNITDGNARLPASYANFLICNDAILCPTYQQVEDQQALSVIQAAYPNHRIVPIDCSTIVKQYGSLHCLTMQVPCNTLKPEIVALFANGVTEYVN